MSKLTDDDIADIAAKVGITADQVAEVLRLADEKKDARKGDKPKKSRTTTVIGNQAPVQTGDGVQNIGGRYT